MTCRRFKKNMVVDIYGDLGPRERRRLEKHLSRCASCKEEFETIRRVVNSLNTSPAEASPEVDWERNWRAVESGLEPARRRRRLLAILPRWAHAPLAVAVLFLLGVVVGRYWWPWRPAVPDAAASRTISPAAEQLILSRYFEDVKPVLLDYAHDGTRARNEELLLTDREIARSLLIQNLLLKRALARKDPALAGLLDDLDLILTEIANLQSQDAATPASLKDVIGQRQVLSRIRSLEKI